MMNMKRIVRFGVLAFVSLVKVLGADAKYENIGNVTVTSQVDAISFINSGSFSVNSAVAYETQNTLYFTNTGSMTGSPGFRLENISSTGVRRPAATFFNGVDAQVFGGGGGQLGPGPINIATQPSLESPQLIISATNIINKGRLHAGADGLVRVHGSKVDLSRSSVGILPFAGGSGFVTETNFIPDVGIFDSYWGMNNDGSSRFQPANLVAPGAVKTNFAVTVGPHGVTNAIGRLQARLNLTNAVAFIFTNAVSPTNWFVDAVFVQVRDPALLVDVRFADSSIPTNAFKTAVVEFTHSETNVLAGGRFLTQIYVIDRAASETNFVQLTNLNTQTTFMPSTFQVSRLTPPEFLAGQKANATNFSGFTNINAAIRDLPSVFQNAGYTNGPTVTNLYSSYRFNVTNVTALLPDVPGASLANLPGRIEIVADELKLDRTRIRGEGIVSIKANSVSGANAVMDVPNVTLDLKSSDGNLLVSGLANDKIERTTGTIDAWSAVWANQTGTIDATAMATNTVDMNFHVLVVDSAQVLTSLDVFVANFTARSTNVVISDTVRIKESLLVEAENLTFTRTVATNSLTLTNAAGVVTNSIVMTTNMGRLIITNSPGFINSPVPPQWNSTTFPRLKNLTNNGAILLPGTASFGADPGQAGYVSVVNRGLISAFNQAFRTDFFGNSGTIDTKADRGSIISGSGTITVESQLAALSGGQFEAGGEIRITANDLLLRNYTNKTARAFVLAVTNSLTEGGAGASNRITSEGFQLTIKPRSGDLLGTTVESIAPPFLAIPHVWAGENRGPTAAGFSNNMALGRLIIRTAFDSLHTFGGVSANNALYTDILQIQGPGTNDIQSALQIDPNFRIYFSNSSTNSPIPGMAISTLTNLPAFRGLLVWIPPSGTSGSPAVGAPAPGLGVAIRISPALQSNTTGASNPSVGLNGFDASVIGGVDKPPTGLNANRPTLITISWPANPNTIYRVETTTSLLSPKWELLLNYSNTANAETIATVSDTVSDQKQRFYRVLLEQ
jgi:hypothetical protein